jgi:hypothetical protein
MGSMIRLALGNLEVDWGNFIHHGPLFRSNDIRDVPYHYYDVDTDQPISEMKEGYSRSLRRIVKRIDLLGYTLDLAAGTS